MAIKKSRLLTVLHASLGSLYVNLVGRISGAEILAVATLPFVGYRRLWHKHRLLGQVLLFLICLLLVQIVSDVINKSLFVNYIRGWSAIFVSIVTIIFLVNNLYNSRNNLAYYLFFSALAGLVFNDHSYSISKFQDDTNAFKVILVPLLNPAVLLLGLYYYRRKNKLIVSSIFFAFGIVCIAMDARSNSIIFLLAALMLYFKNSYRRVSTSKIVIFSTFSVIFLYGCYFFYLNMVLNDNFGGINAQTQLAKVTNLYNPFELLIYGRTDFFVLIMAGLDSPFIGHGSWAPDIGGRYSFLTASIADSSHTGSSEFIRAHSVLMGYFAYGGIFAASLIGLLYFTLWRYAMKLYKTEYFVEYLPIIIVLSIEMLWHLFFSPIGHIRTTFPLIASIIIVEHTRFKERSS